MALPADVVGRAAQFFGLIQDATDRVTAQGGMVQVVLGDLIGDKSRVLLVTLLDLGRDQDAVYVVGGLGAAHHQIVVTGGAPSKVCCRWLATLTVGAT